MMYTFYPVPRSRTRGCTSTSRIRPLDVLHRHKLHALYTPRRRFPVFVLCFVLYLLPEAEFLYRPRLGFKGSDRGLI